MSSNIKDIQTLLETALELSRKKEMEGGSERLLQQIKQLPNFNHLLSNINKKFDGKETPIQWAVRRGCTPILFDALEKLSKEVAQKEESEQWRLTTWVTSKYDLYQDTSLQDGAIVLQIAVKTGNLELVRHLVQKGVNIQTPGSSSAKILHLASESGNVQLVQYLIETCNLNPYEVDAHHRDLFYIADVQGNRELNIYLKAYESSHKLIQETLHRAISAQMDEAALNAAFKELFEGPKSKFFIENINQKFNGLNAVQLAIRMGANAKVMTKLLEISREQARKTAGYLTAAYDVVNDPDTQDGYALLHIAAKLGRNDIVELLLQQKADINQIGKYTGRTPLLCAILAKRSSTVEFLANRKDLELGVNILDRRKKSALIFAIQKNLKDLIPFILRKSKEQAAYYARYNPSYARYNPLGYVVGFDILTASDQRARTPLHYAAKYCRDIDLDADTDILSQLMKLLAEQGKTDAVNAQDNEGLTPLHYAIHAGNLKAVKILVERGKAKIDVPASGLENQTPLLLAARQGYTHIVEFLLTQKCDVNQKNLKQESIFHLAVRSGNVELLQYLLKQPATKNLINEVDRYGRTPLHIAARLGLDVMVKLLMEAAPEQVYALDKHKETPIRSAYKVARTHFHDMRGDSLSSIAVLRTAMNRNIDRKMSVELKQNAELLRRMGDLDAASKQFLAADQQQKVAARPDLITDILEPVMNQDGSITPHQVKILHEGKGFHCLVFIPTNVEGEQTIDLKVVFCTPSQSKDILDSLAQANMLDALRNNIGSLTQKIGEIIQQVSKEHPHSPIGVSVSGKGLGGDDAQYCAYAMMKAIEQDKQFEPVQEFRLVTINAPKANRQLSRDASQLAKKLKSERRLKSVESNHLAIEGSVLPLVGDHYLLGDETVQYLRDTKSAQEMQRLIDIIEPGLSAYRKKDEELSLHKDKMRAVDNEMDTFIHKAETKARLEANQAVVNRETIIATLRNQSRPFRELERQYQDLKQIERKLHGERGELEQLVYQAVEQLKKLENDALNLNLDYGVLHERIPKLQFNISDLSHVALYNPGITLSLGPFQFAPGGRLDQRQARQLDQILRAPRPSLEPLVFSVARNLMQNSAKPQPPHSVEPEQKNEVERKRAVEHASAAGNVPVSEEQGYRDEIYKDLLEHAVKYKRGKSAFEQLYASGEYLYHHVAYQNLIEGDIVPVLTDQGTIENYRVHPIVHLRGMVSFALTPIHGTGEIKFLFRGTHDLDSAIRDLSKKGAGYHSFKGKERVILSKINQIVAKEKARLRAEGLSENIQISIGGHSLGAADAQNTFVLLQQSIAHNKFERMSAQANLRADSGVVGNRSAAEVKTESEKNASQDVLSDPNLRLALGDIFPNETRNQLVGITDIRLQAYNAPGVSHETAWQSRELAKFLCHDDGRLLIKLRAYYQRVNADIVHRTGQAHVLSDCPRRFAEVDVLQFTDYRTRSPVSKLKAHTDKQFTHELSGRTDENLSPGCYERMRNDEQGKILNKAGTLEFDDKLEPNSPLYERVKATLESIVKARLQEPERGTGKRL